MSELFEKLLVDALERGLIIGLTDGGRKFEILDPADDGADQSKCWWPVQGLSNDDGLRFRAHIFSRLRDAPYSVLIGNSVFFDEIFGLFTSTSELLNTSARALGNEEPWPRDRSLGERAKWYRKNIFDHPLGEPWPEEGLTIHDAALLDLPPALRITDELVNQKATGLLASLMTGWLVATGEKSAPGGRRMLIPIIQFETLTLQAWRDDVIKDEHGLVYYGCRIHSPENIPSQFRGKVKTYKTQWRNRMQSAAVPPDPKLNWTVMNWIDEFYPKYAVNNVSPQSIADAIHKNEYTPFSTAMKGKARPLALSSFRRMARNYRKR